MKSQHLNLVKIVDFIKIHQTFTNISTFRGFAYFTNSGSCSGHKINGETMSEQNMISVVPIPKYQNKLSPMMMTFRCLTMNKSWNLMNGAVIGGMIFLVVIN